MGALFFDVTAGVGTPRASLVRHYWRNGARGSAVVALLPVFPEIEADGFHFFCQTKPNQGFDDKYNDCCTENGKQQRNEK
jgi:hypothetical protein